MTQKPNYGFPLSSIIFRIFFSMILLLIIIILICFQIPIFQILSISITLLLIYITIGIIYFKKRFLKFRKIILEKMIEYAKLEGNEKILDLGTGAGFLAIGFAKKITNGRIYGVDRFNLKYKNLLLNIKNIIKINFIGHTLKNAKNNAKIENVFKKSIFIKSDLTEKIDFPINTFDIIVSSQFLYCLPQNKRQYVFQEIDRVLKKNGKLIFFESKSFLSWNINIVKDFFEKKDYTVEIFKFKRYRTGCIFFAKKH